jgi:hypothetical protein
MQKDCGGFAVRSVLVPLLSICSKLTSYRSSSAVRLDMSKATTRRTVYRGERKGSGRSRVLWLSWFVLNHIV